jgi:hypothetical protein
MAPAEASAPDVALPDQVVPDQVVHDQVVPDQYVHDQVVPDQVVHDQYVHDQVVHDQYVHDQVVPDMMQPDTAVVVDAAPSDAVVPPPDGTATGDGGTTGGPYTIIKGEIGVGVPAVFNRSMVRNAIGELFYCYRTGTAPYDLNIARSINGGVTWSDWAKKLNTETFAYNLSGCSLAVDRNSNIYAVWHRYNYSPTRHGTYLRKYDPNSGKWSSLVTIKQVNNKVSSSAVAVDSQGYVYVVAGTSSSWKTHLHKSKNPYASALSFTDLGDLSTSSYSQTGVLTIDSKDTVHVLYYSVTASTGAIFHRTYSTSWGTPTVISTAKPPNDKPGPMAADSLGNVHITYIDNGGDKNSADDFMYRKWSGGKMGSPIKLWSHSTTQHGNYTICNPYIFNIATNEATGDVYVMGRNMNEGGAFVLYKKTNTGTAFSKVKVLRPANSTKHYYYLPRVRGTVYPTFNQTGKLLDIAYQEDHSSTTNKASKFLRVAAP